LVRKIVKTFKYLSNITKRGKYPKERLPERFFERKFNGITYKKKEAG